MYCLESYEKKTEKIWTPAIIMMRNKSDHSRICKKMFCMLWLEMPEMMYEGHTWDRKVPWDAESKP